MGNSSSWNPPTLFSICCALMISLACASADAQSNSQGRAEAKGRSFEARLWNYLIANNYKNWAPPTGQDGRFFRGQPDTPHGQLLKMYVNRAAAVNLESLPDESLLVLENYRADKSLATIAVMLRSDGANPDGDDWYWVTYRPDGTVAESTGSHGSIEPVLPRSKAGSIKASTASASQSCIQCHQQALGNDFVFFNDEKYRVASEKPVGEAQR